MHQRLSSVQCLCKNVRCMQLHFYFYVRDYKCKFYTLFYTSQQLSLVCIFTVYATIGHRLTVWNYYVELFASCYIQVCMRNYAVWYSRAGQFCRSIDMQNLLLMCVTVKVLTLRIVIWVRRAQMKQKYQSSSCFQIWIQGILHKQ